MKSSRGFTIVELLIVIVVIAILAVVTVVAYNGIQSRSKQSVNQAAIAQYLRAFQLMKTESGSLPAGAGVSSACLGPIPQPETCGLAGQNATASSNSTANVKSLLAQYGMNSQPAVGRAYTDGYLVYTSTFYGEPALLWQVPVDQDCVASPKRFLAGGNVWTDGLTYSSRSGYTTCYMSLKDL